MKHRVWVMGVSLLLSLACVGLTACGGEAEGTEEVMGRLTSVSDSQIEVEVFDKGEGHGPEAASGGAVGGEEMKRPEGTPPTDMKQGERPEGTPPADMPEGGQGGPKDDGGDPGSARGLRTGEKRTFAINDDTKFYKQDGEEKTEITADEVELGTMLSVSVDEDTAVTVTVQSTGGRRISRD